MPDWLATVLVAAGSAALAALAALKRSGRSEAERDARVDQAAKHADSAHVAIAALGESVAALGHRVSSLETGRAVHEERFTRLQEDVAYIRKGIDELRGRA